MRIEDTDQQRSREEYIHSICADLTEMGITWDEGPDKEGAYAPYRQARRANVYAKFYTQLERQGLAYPCFCTEASLRLSRKRQLAAGKPPCYSGTCRSLSKEEVESRLAGGEKPALRIKVADEAVLSFVDLVRGKQVFYGKHIGDFVIRRNDGSASFMFANAIDDALMEIDCVLRGEDHLTNTPRQLLVLEALELKPPNYGHISILLGDDGRPLSKRNGSRTISELLREGYLPLALLNLLARLGCSYETAKLLNLKELIEHFSIERLISASARYETRQLKHWQRYALEEMSPEELWHWLAPSLGEKVPAERRYDFAATVSSNILLPREASLWADIIFAQWNAQEHINQEGLSLIRQAGSDFFFAAEALFQKVYRGNGWEIYAQALGKETGKKGKQLFMPLRLALTGLFFGPELDPLVALLGREETVRRLKAAATA